MGMNMSLATTVRWLTMETMKMDPSPICPSDSGLVVQRQST